MREPTIFEMGERYASRCSPSFAFHPSPPAHTGFHAEKNYKKRGGPPRATGYENAIRGIQACTTKFEHPSELKGVPGVGPTCIGRYVAYFLTCDCGRFSLDSLAEKLEGHCARNGIDMPQPKGRAKKQGTCFTSMYFGDASQVEDSAP